ncbi:hypothetical protein EJB05_35366, partial [Eragrostis curvula]
MGQASSDLSSEFDDVCGDCAVLRAQLAALAATTPSCVYGKRLSAGAHADLRHGLLSVVGEHFTAALTGSELGTVVDHDMTGGLDVPVFDRDGTRYDFNNVVCGDAPELFMEVWAFHSLALRKGRKPVDGGHPDGALGMVVLFFDDLDTEESEDEVFDDDDNRPILHLLRHCLKVPEGYELEQFI